MQYLFYILLIPFLYFNYKIIISDIKYKIIPNKYLGYLLLLIPFWWMILLNNPAPSPLPLGISEGGIDVLLFIGQVILTFIISFILYSFGIWSAGDAKYLLVLSLFIPYIGVIPFIGNIALLTIAYLLLYFIWFYFGKCIFGKCNFYKCYNGDLFLDIEIDLKKKWIIYKSNKGGKTFFIILKWIVIFLIIFVSIRLARIYLFNEIFTGETSQIEVILLIIKTYSFYLIFLLIILFVGGLYIFNILINKIKIILSGKLGVNIIIIGNILIIFLFILLISFIIYEYLINPNVISYLLFKIFTIYISIYIFVKIIIYGYKITFGIAETEYINIKYLKEGDIIDKDYLRKILSYRNIKNKITMNNYKYNMKYIQKLENPINSNTILNLKSIFNKTNNICINDNIIKKEFNYINVIKILKTFSFAPYIFTSLIITFIFNDSLIIYIINSIFFILNTFSKNNLY